MSDRRTVGTRSSEDDAVGPWALIVVRGGGVDLSARENGELRRQPSGHLRRFVRGEPLKNDMYVPRTTARCPSSRA